MPSLPLLRHVCLTIGLSLAWSVVRAQSQPDAVDAPAPAASQPAEQTSPDTVEPDVHRTVIDDGGTRIDELRIRGQTQRITVTPKIGITKSYEIVTGDGSRDVSFGAFSQRGAIGKSVWYVLSF